MSVYYADDDVTLHLGDCREVMNGADADLLLTDPPYGINYRTSSSRSGATKSHDWRPIAGDQGPFDPAHLLGFPKVVLFGANYYADKLPTTGSWIIWDKVDGLPSKRAIGFNNQADCEMAWTNCGGPARILRHRWMGMIKASEHGQRRVHPTQKPVALMKQIIEWRTMPGETVLDPYAGSGSTLLAAAATGRKAIGVEIDEAYCEVIATRLQAAKAA